MGPRSASGSKVPRGLTGPGRSPFIEIPAPNPTSDNTQTLLASAMAMMVHSMTATMQKSRAHSFRSSSLPPSSPPRGSSLPPAIDDELQKFLDAFAKAKEFFKAVIDGIYERLDNTFYSPDAISKESLLISQLQELTGLPEGQVYALRKFSHAWCRKIDAKRAKLRKD
jgi:hypothetical protein